LGDIARLLIERRNEAGFKKVENLRPAALSSLGALILPLICAAFLAVFDFSGLVLLLLILYILYAFLLSLMLRKNLACKHCRQGEIGCPAYECMFKKILFGR